eukprot:TRINITY_DN12103_c0_g1_i1.p1 TRINITY_DN12103_c0_g1~~TRINITY_DN12103_c0_g1_i1.p1  ORF type:complete len:572 (-),score=96.42 TRINITY_DN12103_c0_g1_i1:313-2028(-)
MCIRDSHINKFNLDAENIKQNEKPNFQTINKIMSVLQLNYKVPPKKRRSEDFTFIDKNDLSPAFQRQHNPPKSARDRENSQSNSLSNQILQFKKQVLEANIHKNNIQPINLYVKYRICEFQQQQQQQVLKQYSNNLQKGKSQSASFKQFLDAASQNHPPNTSKTTLQIPKGNDKEEGKRLNTAEAVYNMLPISYRVHTQDQDSNLKTSLSQQQQTTQNQTEEFVDPVLDSQYDGTQINQIVKVLDLDYYKRKSQDFLQSQRKGFQLKLPPKKNLNGFYTERHFQNEVWNGIKNNSNCNIFTSNNKSTINFCHSNNNPGINNTSLSKSNDISSTRMATEIINPKGSLSTLQDLIRSKLPQVFHSKNTSCINTQITSQIVCQQFKAIKALQNKIRQKRVYNVGSDFLQISSSKNSVRPLTAQILHSKKKKSVTSQLLTSQLLPSKSSSTLKSKVTQLCKTLGFSKLLVNNSAAFNAQSQNLSSVANQNGSINKDKDENANNKCSNNTDNVVTANNDNIKGNSANENNNSNNNTNIISNYNNQTFGSPIIGNNSVNGVNYQKNVETWINYNSKQ